MRFFRDPPTWVWACIRFRFCPLPKRSADRQSLRRATSVISPSPTRIGRWRSGPEAGWYAAVVTCDSPGTGYATACPYAYARVSVFRVGVGSTRRCSRTRDTASDDTVARRGR